MGADNFIVPRHIITLIQYYSKVRQKWFGIDKILSLSFVMLHRIPHRGFEHKIVQKCSNYALQLHNNAT